MSEMQRETPTSRAASGGQGADGFDASTPDYINPVSETPTTEQWRKMDAYNETVLLRGLMYCSYADVLMLCRGQDPRALYSEPRRLILRALQTVANRAVEHQHGDDSVTPAAITAELMKYPGPEARTAPSQVMPQVLAGPVEGSHTTTPNVFEVPRLWETVHNARLWRALDSVGRSMVSEAETRDPSWLPELLRRLRYLPRLVEAAGMDLSGADTHNGHSDDRRTA